KTEILGLYMQKVNNESMANPENNSPQLARLSLKQNYPNPFNPHTNIALSLPQSGALSLKIYNAKGQLVKEVFSGDLPKGEHSFSWDGKDARGRDVASGVYFYTAKTAKDTRTRKMLLMK
ncbi:MAG: FlgD immunoglobulin-like domain containing protein, partial [Candidatus Cloacimonadaceae bacterium]